MANHFSSNQILVFGANGQLGRAFRELLGNDALYFTREEADFFQPGQVRLLLEKLDPFPRAVINAAAYTAVDKAEDDEINALLANATTPAVIANYCAARSIPFIHYSTDYVFPGAGETPWKEDDIPLPLNAYGRTKLEGERRIRKAGGNWLIFRTSWVYDAEGKNFLNTILRLGAERESLSVVNDQYGAPTYAAHIAKATLEVLEHCYPGSFFRHPERSEGSPSGKQDGKGNLFPSGIYHLCNSGVTTWHGFAEAIFQAARARGMALKVSEVKGIPTTAYPTPAKRPLNSRLDCSKLQQVFGVSLPSWQEGLAEVMDLKAGV